MVHDLDGEGTALEFAQALRLPGEIEQLISVGRGLDLQGEKRAAAADHHRGVDGEHAVLVGPDLSDQLGASYAYLESESGQCGLIPTFAQTSKNSPLFLTFPSPFFLSYNVSLSVFLQNKVIPPLHDVCEKCRKICGICYIKHDDQPDPDV